MVYRFERSFILEKGFLSSKLKPDFRGGIGFVMLSNYFTSNAGPYREIIFIPGKFERSGKKRYSITKIYVSTETSAMNGRENWAIPKETAFFKWEKHNAGFTHIQVQNRGETFFDLSIQDFGFPFPVLTDLFQLPLVHTKNDVDCLTKLNGKGWGRLARIKRIDICNQYFPNIGRLKPILAFNVTHFRLNFPVGKIAIPSNTRL